MNWRYFVLISFLFTNIIVPFQTGYEPQTLNVWLNDGEYAHFTAQSNNPGVRMYGNFTLNKGEYIEFFICDDGNFSEWLAGRPTQVHDYQEVTDFYEFYFVAPYGDLWHLVLSNVNLTSSGTRQVTGFLTRDMAPPTGVTPDLTTFTITVYAAGAAAVIVIVLAVWYTRRTSSQF